MIRCGTAVFAMRGDGSFLLIKRADGRAGEGLWSVPGGAIEDGETWQEATSRELSEETMLGVPEPHLLAITTADNWLTIWSAGPLKGIVRPAAAEEVADMQWVTCGDLWKYDLWKAHWTPLLDQVGGTVELDRKLRGRNS